MTQLVDIVFDGPPSHESGRFVEVEDMQGASVKVGEWLERPNGFWALRLNASEPIVGPGSSLETAVATIRHALTGTFREREDWDEASGEALEALADLEPLRDADYRAGFEAALRAYAYSSSEPWAENGVQYVGTTGCTLAEAIAQIEDTYNYAPPSRR